jgi:hypothetical protein
VVEKLYAYVFFWLKNFMFEILRMEISLPKNFVLEMFVIGNFLVQKKYMPEILVTEIFNP